MSRVELDERIRHLIDSAPPVELEEVPERSRTPAFSGRRVGRWGHAAPVIVAVGIAAAAVAVVLVPGSPRPTTVVESTGGSSSSLAPSSTEPTTPATQAPVSSTTAPSPTSSSGGSPPVPDTGNLPSPGTFTVPGYTASTAAAAVEACMDSLGPATVTSGYTLRAAFSDPYGSELLITSASDWSMCGVSTAGDVVHGTVSVPEAYAATDGWGTQSVPPGDAPASWLTSPVELDFAGGGVVTLPSGGGFLWTVEGRAAAGITEVTAGMPDGSQVSAPVQNGLFVARKLFSSDPVTDAPGSGPQVISLQGFDHSGALVYTNPSTPEPSCFVTPSGQEVTPPSAAGSSADCETATPW